MDLVSTSIGFSSETIFVIIIVIDSTTSHTKCSVTSMYLALSW